MPNLDGTGFNNNPGKKLKSTDRCVCPKCKKEQPHSKGVPCSTQTCEECKVSLKGTNCLDKE